MLNLLEPANAAEQQIAQDIYKYLLKYFQEAAEAAAADIETQSKRTLKVRVDDTNFEYQLNEADVSAVFSRFGIVSSVEISPDASSAIVVYEHPLDAQRAILELNGRCLNGINGKLNVSWEGLLIGNLKPGFHIYRSQTPEIPAEGSNDSGDFLSCWESGARQNSSFPQSQDGAMNNMDYNMMSTNFDDKMIRKYTCRFEIGIENDKEFFVARRIIGQKGANMKRIVKLSEAKLRLRGKGSGFLEGTNKQESTEPLHLCISCKDYGGYCTAVEQVEILLNEIYNEFRCFCKEKGLPEPTELKVNMKEHPLMSCSSSATNHIGDFNVPFDNRYMMDYSSVPQNSGFSFHNLA